MFVVSVNASARAARALVVLLIVFFMDFLSIQAYAPVFVFVVRLFLKRAAGLIGLALKKLGFLKVVIAEVSCSDNRGKSRRFLVECPRGVVSRMKLPLPWRVPNLTFSGCAGRRMHSAAPRTISIILSFMASLM